MQLCSLRRQQTIASPVELAGFGLFGGEDVCARFRPAPPNHGLVFERIDLPQPVRIPALIRHVVPQPRCTVIGQGDAQVAVIEHILAALAGLRIDNCLIQLDAAEAPILDGSALPFCEALRSAGIVEQEAPRQAVRIEEVLIHTESEDVAVGAQPGRRNEYEIGFFLDYGAAGIPVQDFRLEITPETFLQEVAPCRTFATELEVRELRSHGLATRATTSNAVVYGERGPIQSRLRKTDECVRHKILDCVGDFALLGMDLLGRFTATRSGHRLNHALIREIEQRITPPSLTVPAPHKSPARSRATVKK